MHYPIERYLVGRNNDAHPNHEVHQKILMIMF